MNRNFAVILAAALVAPAVTSAQSNLPRERAEEDNTRFGGTSAVFLTLPADARGAALGGSFAALVSDVTSVFYNPAGLALLTTKQVMFSHTAYFADTRHIAAGIGWSLRGGDMGLGVSLSNFGFGDQPVYTEAAQEGNGETYSVSNTAVGLTTAFQFSDRFSAGVTGRYITEGLGSVKSTGFTIDFGTNYHAEIGGKPIRASFIIINYGPSLKPRGAVLNEDVDAIDESMNVERPAGELRTSGFEPPTQFRVGLAYDIMESSSNRLTLLSEFFQPNDSDPGVGLGAEFNATLREGLSAGLRGSYGYQGDNRDSDPGSTVGFRSSAKDDDALDGFSVGGGLSWAVAGMNVGVDYAFRHMGILSSVNQFTIKLGW
ncbi:MAG: PorV/PorQ family protein [Gemmatimonadota bacterium]